MAQAEALERTRSAGPRWQFRLRGLGRRTRRRRCRGLCRRRAEPQDFLTAISLFDQLRIERIADEIVPAAVRPLSFAVGAADDQPVSGTRHRHIEEPAIFVARLG